MAGSPGTAAHSTVFQKNLVEILEKNGFEIEAYLPFGAFPPYFYISPGLFKFIGKG